MISPTVSTALRTRNVQSLLNQAGLTGLTFCGIRCRVVEPGNPYSEWQVLDSPAPEDLTEPEMHLQYVAMAYPSIAAAQAALRELTVREPIDLVARQAYWEVMRDQADVIFEFLGLK